MEIISGVVEAASSTALQPAASVDYEISARTRELIDDGHAANTRRAYAQQAEWFRRWCDETGRSSFPVTTETFTEYVAHLADIGQAPSTIKQAMAAIRIAHRDLKVTPPDTRDATLVLRGYRRRRAEEGQRTKQATPIVVDALQQLVAATSPATTAGLRDRTIITLGFALFGRRSELAALQIADLRETPNGLLVHIARSKTDQNADGTDVAIPQAKKNPDVCPVRAARLWRAKLAEAGIVEGPFLRRVDRHGNIGRSLSPDSVNRLIKAMAVRAELPAAADYTAHSLRAGGATAAYASGVPISAVSRHGRWADGSATVQRYIRAVDQWKDNPLRDVL